MTNHRDDDDDDDDSTTAMPRAISRTNFVTLMPYMDEAFGFKPTQESVLKKLRHTFDMSTHEHTVTLEYIVTEEPTHGRLADLIEHRRRAAPVLLTLAKPTRRRNHQEE